MVHQAVLEAKETFRKVRKQNKEHKTNSYIHFKSMKTSRQTFSHHELSKGKLVAPKAIGDFHSTEEIPNESIGHTCSVSFERGRWFIQVYTTTETKAEIQGNVNVVGIDPGIRTFGTCYSSNEVIEFGSNFVNEKLIPLTLKYRKLISERQKLLNLKSKQQWVSDRIKNLNKRIHKIQNRKSDLVHDLHQRTAHLLVSTYDVIFLPTFETQKMSIKKNRKINRSSTRSILDLSHYKFKLMLKWYAKKYGKVIVDCNESYTSKTLSWNGLIDDKLGSKKIIKDENYAVNRDINGARGILIKQLSF